MDDLKGKSEQGVHRLEIDSVILSFGDRRVLQDIYLRCDTGKVTGLLGPNGSGKTCLIEIIFGQRRAEQASVRIDGSVLPGVRRRAGDMACLPQQHFIPGYLTLERVCRDYGISRDALLSRFPEFETRFGERIGSMSGGERRLLELFTVLSCRARFILLDEPFSYLMPRHTALCRELIRDAAHTRGVLVTDHLFRQVVELSDELYLIGCGRTLRAGGPEDLIRYGYAGRL